VATCRRDYGFGWCFSWAWPPLACRISQTGMDAHKMQLLTFSCLGIGAVITIYLLDRGFRFARRRASFSSLQGMR